MRKRITTSRRSAEDEGPGRKRRPGRHSLAVRSHAALGYTVVEIVFVAGLIVTLGGMAVPSLVSGLDEYRTAGAARHVSTRMQRARMEAVARSTEVAMQFIQAGVGYSYAVYMDGDHNGVRTNDIQSGADPPVGSAERLPDHFGGVDFSVQPGLPAVDGGAAPGNDPIRLGVSNLASFSPVGTATSGSVYIRGRSAQYVVRVFGATGKIRVLKFDQTARQWKPL